MDEEDEATYSGYLAYRSDRSVLGRFGGLSRPRRSSLARLRRAGGRGRRGRGLPVCVLGRRAYWLGRSLWRRHSRRSGFPPSPIRNPVGVCVLTAVARCGSLDCRACKPGASVRPCPRIAAAPEQLGRCVFDLGARHLSCRRRDHVSTNAGRPCQRSYSRLLFGLRGVGRIEAAHQRGRQLQMTVALFLTPLSLGTFLWFRRLGFSLGRQLRRTTPGSWRA